RRVLVSFSFVCLTHSAACRLNPSSWPSRTFIRALTSNRVIVIPFHTVRSYYGNRSRLSGHLAFFGLWHAHEFSLVGRALEQIGGAAGLGQRQALGHDRVDLVRTQQLEQREEVLPEPFLVRDAQLLDPVGDHPAAGREQAPEPYGRGRRVPLDQPSPALAPTRHRVVVAVHDKPPAGVSDEKIAAPQCAAVAQRDRAADPVEHAVHTLARQLTHRGQELLVLRVDRHRAEPLDRGAVTSRRGPDQVKPGQRPETDLRELLERFEHLGMPIGMNYTRAYLADVLMEQGRVGEAEQVLSESGPGDDLRDHAHLLSLMDSRARLSIVKGETRRGVAELLDAGRRFEAVGGFNPAFLPWRSGAAVALAKMG